MSRWLIALAGLAALLGAWLLPPREVPVPESAVEVEPATYRVCAVVPSREATADLHLASDRTGAVSLSLVTAAGVESAGSVDLTTAGGASTTIDAGAPGALVVEDVGPNSAATVVTFGPQGLGAATCGSRPSTTQMVVGPSTLEGDSAELVLANPFTQDAVVTVRSTSELGLDSVSGLESITVPARSVVTRDLGEVLQLRTVLSLVVSTQQGAVVSGARYLPASGGFAIIEGVEPVQDWWIPLPENIPDARVVIATDSPSPVPFQVDSYGSLEVIEAFTEGSVDAGTIVSLSRGDLPDDVTAVRVVAAAPVVASAVFVTDGTAAAGPGAPGLSFRWLLPGGGSLPDVDTVAWIVNPNADELNLTLQPLVPDAVATVVPLPGEAMTPVLLPSGALTGYLLSADGEIAVSWTSRPQGGDRAFDAGVPLDG